MATILGGASQKMTAARGEVNDKIPQIEVMQILIVSLTVQIEAPFNRIPFNQHSCSGALVRKIPAEP